MRPPLPHHFLIALAGICGLLNPQLVGAQQGAQGKEVNAAIGAPRIDGSPAPTAPATITRDAQGRATVRAIRLSEPLRLDGELDEAVYTANEPFGGFVQVAPNAGSPSSERTDVWISFDDENLYVTCRCWDEAPPETWIVNELRRDATGIRTGEHFGVMFDTFYDRRNGSMFYANHIGGRTDYSVADEGSVNRDWNPVWDVAGGRFDGGWTLEMSIPFKSLRYAEGQSPLWGLQLRRSIRHKNEWTYLNPVPAFMAGPQGFNSVSSGGTLVGLDVPPAGSNVELKPYGLTGLGTDRVVTPTVENDLSAEVGFDVKYGVSANLTADLTVNTDFAQVEVDEQQVNLTRFSQFFPEKREFFLEGRGVFDFGQGGSPGFGGGGGGRGGGFGGGGGDAPTIFHSRRIGLQDGTLIPIQAGGRLTGKAGAFGIGAINIQTAGVDDIGVGSTNYSVLRVKRDILRRSSIGAIFTNRSLSESGVGSNQVYGADAAFAFFTNLTAGAYWARTETTGTSGDNQSWQTRFSYAADRYGLNASVLEVDTDFNPEVGFLRRTGFRKSSATARFSPRPTSVESIRKLTWSATLDYYEDADGRLESRSQQGRFDVELENSDEASFEATRAYERLVDPFELTEDLTIGTGSYDFTDYRVNYNFGSQRRLSGNVSYRWGGFFDGSIRSITVNQGRMVVTERLSLEPGISVNRLTLPSGESTQTVGRLRSDYAFTPRVFASALIQYNSASNTLSSNLRFRWEYRPGSELFVVWTDERDSRAQGTGLRSRALVFKATRLLRY
ncbi:MAG: DUF5916 domain-containing protein [Longimicrobiales bacterium]